MKVVHIIPSLEKGGAERLAIDICRALGALEGVQVVLLVLRSKIDYKVANENFEIKVIPSTVALSLLKKNVLNVDELEQFMEEFKPDIIHSHLFQAEIVSRSISYKGAAYFSHLHSRMPQFRKLQASSLFSKKHITDFYERTYLIGRYRALGGNRFIAIANDTLNYFRQVLPADLQRIDLLHNAIDVKRFLRKDPAASRRVLSRLVTVGRLVQHKNQQFLIEVVRCLHQAGQLVSLDILGDGPDRHMLEQKVASNKLEQYVKFHGNVERVEDILWESDLYVHGALSEPFGLVFPEAMAAGLPVVAVDGGGNRDIIQNGRNGYILPAPTAEQFAEKVKLLLNDRQAYNNMRENAIKDAGNYDIDNYARQLVTIYKDELRMR